MNFHLSERKFDIVKQWLQQNGRVNRAWIFGSRTKGKARPDSELDLAFEIIGSNNEAELTWLNCARTWQQKLDTATSQHPRVDLQPAFPDDDVVTPAVKSHGVLIFEGSPK